MMNPTNPQKNRKQALVVAIKTTGRRMKSATPIENSVKVTATNSATTRATTMLRTKVVMLKRMKKSNGMPVKTKFNPTRADNLG